MSCREISSRRTDVFRIEEAVELEKIIIESLVALRGILPSLSFLFVQARIARGDRFSIRGRFEGTAKGGGG